MPHLAYALKPLCFPMEYPYRPLYYKSTLLTLYCTVHWQYPNFRIDFLLSVFSPPLQVQNQLNAFMVLAAVLWCVLGAVTMILQDHSTQQAVIALWYVRTPYT